MRSGIKIIRGRAGSHYCTVQGERGVVDRASMSDKSINEEMCIVTRPYALGLEISASGVAALGNSTTIPCARRLAITNFRTQCDRG